MRIIALLAAIALLAYPFAVYYGLNNYGMSSVAMVLVLLFILRIFVGSSVPLKELKYVAWITGVSGVLLTLLGMIFKDEGWFTFYPVIVNLFMLILFAVSLFQKQSMIERFARLQAPELPDSGVLYTRKVTMVWSLFFIINGSISLATCFQSMEIWTLYNGLISYLLMGTLFGIEFIIRKRVQASGA